MATVRELVTKLGFEVDDKKLKSLDDAVKNVRQSITALATAGAAAAAGLFALAKSTATAGDEIAKTSSRVGFSATSLQEWRYAAERAGVSSADFSKSLSIFNRRIGLAAQGTGPAIQAIRQLGISVSNTNGEMRSQEDILNDVADKMSQIEDSATRAAILDQILGEVGRGQIDFFGLGSKGIKELREESHQLGVILSTQTIKSSERFGDALHKLITIVTGLKNSLGAGLLDMISDLVERFSDWVLVNRELIRLNLEEFIRGLIALTGTLVSLVSSLWRAFEFVAQAVGGATNAFKIIMVAFAGFKIYSVAVSLGIIMKALYGATVALIGFSTAFYASPAGLIVLAVALGALLIKLLFFTDKGKELMQSFVDWIKSLWGSFTGWFAAVTDKMLGTITAVIDSVKRAFGAVGGVFKRFFGAGGSTDINLNEASTVDIATGIVRPSAVSANNKNSTVNVNSEVVVNVPPGTSNEQARFVQQAAKESFKAEYERELERALFENAELE